jgi:capsular polysaccharide biosynthesis protein
MSMYELTAILWRRRTLIAAVAVGLFLVGTIGVVLSRNATYTARSQVIVDQPGLLVAQGGGDVPNKLSTLLPTICDLLQGDSASSAVAAEAGSSTGQARSVSCVPAAGALVVTLAATSTNPDVSQRLANASADQLTTAVTSRYNVSGVPPVQRITASVLRSATRPGKNSNHSTELVGIVAVGAIIVAAAFGLAAEPHRRDYLAVGAGPRLASVALPED